MSPPVFHVCQSDGAHGGDSGGKEGIAAVTNGQLFIEERSADAYLKTLHF